MPTGKDLLPTEELEQPAKRYELVSIATQMEQQNQLLQTLVTQSGAQISAKQFEERIIAVTTSFNDRIADETRERIRGDDELKKALGENTKAVNRNNQNMGRFIWAVIGVGITIVGSAVSIILFSGNQ